MNSALYECRLLHRRVAPREHSFRNRLFFFRIDLDEVSEMARSLFLFSRNRRNLYEFRDDDYFPGAAGSPPSDPGGPSLKSRVTDYLQGHGLAATQSRVVLVTVPRICGYHFNPVSFYYCYDADGSPLCAIAEVTNTFREVKQYLLPPSALGAKGFRFRLPKFFYVSPFARADGEFDFFLGLPDEKLVCRIDEYESGELLLHSFVSGARRPLGDAALLWFALRYPALGLQTMFRIHQKALKLYLMRVPYFRKAEHPEHQKDFHDPHSTGSNDPCPDRRKSEPVNVENT